MRTSIGGRCKARERLSRAVLIAREAWPVQWTYPVHLDTASAVKVSSPIWLKFLSRSFGRRQWREGHTRSHPEHGR